MKINALLFFTMLLLSGCDDYDIKSCAKEVNTYHSLYGGKGFEAIYDEMTNKDFKSSMTKGDYMSFMNKTYSILGYYDGGVLKKSNEIKVLVGDETVELIYSSTYQKYKLDEFFILKQEDGKCKIKKIVYDDIHAIKVKSN